MENITVLAYQTESSTNDRAYSSCFMHRMTAHRRLFFFKKFSNFVHFCPNILPFLAFFCPFSEKLHACPFFLE